MKKKMFRNVTTLALTTGLISTTLTPVSLSHQNPWNDNAQKPVKKYKDKTLDDVLEALGLNKFKK